MAPHVCVACGNYDTSVTYFRIPKEGRRRKSWLKGCGIDLDCVLQDRATICRLHFTDDSFARSSDKVNIYPRLKKSAVPSICVDASKLKSCRTGLSGKQKRNRCFSCGSSKNLEKYSLHRFPKDIEHRNKWIKNLGLENVSPLPTHESRLCSKHFSESDLVGNPKVTTRFSLRKGAVPRKIINEANPTFQEVHHAIGTNILSNDYVAEIDSNTTDNFEIECITTDTSDYEFVPNSAMDIDIHGHAPVEIVETNIPEALLQNTAGSDVKGKWRGLRDTFRKEVVKINKGRTGDTEDNRVKSRWGYFHMMEFLKDTLTNRNVSNNISMVSQDAEDSFTLSSDHAEMLEVIEEPHTDHQLLTNDYADELVEIVRSVPNKFKQDDNKTTAVHNDSHYHFLMSLLPELKKVPEHRQLHARIKIQQVLLEEQQR